MLCFIAEQIGVSDRDSARICEQRIHRARYAAIARETTILSAQHLSRFDTQRRLATLVVFSREIEAILTDAALVMFDKMLGSVFRRADQAHKEHVADTPVRPRPVRCS
jgi:hypothetical protein